MVKFIKVHNEIDAIDQALRNNGCDNESIRDVRDHGVECKSLAGIKRSVNAFWADCSSNDYVAALVQDRRGIWTASIGTVAA